MATFDNYKLVIPAGFYNIVFEHLNNEVPDAMLCSLGYGGAGYTLTQSDLDDIANLWSTTVGTALSDQVLFTRATAYDAGGSVLETYVNSPGDDVGSIGPLSNCVLVEKRTGVSGRANRGRLYLPGVEESHVGPGGILDSAQQLAYQTVMDDLLTGINAIDVLSDVVLLHSKGWNGPYNPVPADPGTAGPPTVITSFVVGSKIGTQRRRIR